MDLSSDCFYEVINSGDDVNTYTDDSPKVTNQKVKTRFSSSTDYAKEHQRLTDIIHKTLLSKTNTVINETNEKNVGVEKLPNILHKMVSSDITIDDFVKTLQIKIDSLKPKEQCTIKVPHKIIYNRTITLNSKGCATITELIVVNVQTIIYWVVNNTPKDVYCNIRGYTPGPENMNLTIDLSKP